MSLYHVGCNLRNGVRDTIFARYRDFPEPVRQRGQENF